MRLKVVIGTLLAGGALVLALLFFLSPAPSRPGDARIEPSGPEAGHASGSNVVRPGTATSGAALGPAALDPEAAVNQRLEELGRLALMNDTASRDTLLLELHNPDWRIRAEALEALVQFGDRSVIPQLEEMAAQTQDPLEKQAIQEAVQYLKLPSLTEHLAEKRARQAGLTNAAAPSRQPATAFPREPSSPSDPARQP
jgi:hypothetical protein